MAFATLDRVPIVDAKVVMPRVGVWTADIRVSADAAPTGVATLAIDGGLTLVGTVHSSRVWEGDAVTRLVAGADGLAKVATPRHYQQTDLALVLRDLLRDAGETLAASSSATTLRQAFGYWTTIGQPVGRMISALLADRRLSAATAWRLLPDGTLWVGPETWPDSGLRDVIDYQDIIEDPSVGAMRIGIEAPSLVPGVLIGGRKVGHVEHEISGEGARTTAWLES